jgi:hypothetical protein
MQSVHGDGSGLKSTAGGDMRRRSVALVTIILLFCCVEVQAVQADLIANFQDEYPAAAARVEEAYGHATILTTETYRDPDGSITLVTENEYLREEEFVRIVTEVVQSTNPEAPVGTITASGGSAESYFKAGKDANASEFVIHLLKPTANFDLIFRDNARPVFAPYCIFNLRIIDYLNYPGVRILSATKMNLDGREAIAILTEWRFQEPDSPPDLIHYRFYFQPDTWALLGFTLYTEPQDPGASVDQHRLSYEPGSDPSRLATLEIWAESPLNPDEGRSKQGGMFYKIKSIEFGEIPKEEFTLAALGIEEPVMAGSGTSIPWVIINVIIFGGLGIGFALLAVRRRKGAAAA